MDVDLVHLGLVSSWRLSFSSRFARHRAAVDFSKRPEILPAKAHHVVFSAGAEYECMGLTVWIGRVMASSGSFGGACTPFEWSSRGIDMGVDLFLRGVSAPLRLRPI